MFEVSVIGGVRTRACLCTTDLKSVPLDRSGTMTYATKAIFNVKISRKERIPCYLYIS